MRVIRNVLFAVLAVGCFILFQPAVVVADQCYLRYHDEGPDCYPDESSYYESFEMLSCWSECYDYGGVCQLDVFSWSNPCSADSYCYSDVPIH